MRDRVPSELTIRDDDFSFDLKVDGKPIELVVALNGAPHEQGLAIARQLVAALPSLVPRAWKEAADACLPLINGGYLEPGETPVTRDDFLRRATLTGLSGDVAGGVSFHLDDGDMLWGHYITVHCTLDGSVWDVQMSG
jgi:hypothetical protein